jgi:raffinose/stachyose/melibiose transport system permease protein
LPFRLRRKPAGGPREVPWLLAVPAVLLTVAGHFVAFAWGGWYAFTDWDGLTEAKWIGLDNFRHIFSEDATSTAFWNTLKLAGSFVFLVNTVGLVLALALNRGLKTRFLLRSLFFVPFVIMPLAVAYIWQYIFDNYGALNQFLDKVGLESWVRPWLGDPNFALWTVLVVLVWQYSGFTTMIYLAGLQGIPEELEEAAAVDGATLSMRLRRITLPLLAPAFTVNLVLMSIIGLRVFDQVVALTFGGPVDASETLATQVWKQTFVLGHFGYGAALALLLAGLIAVIGLAQLVFLRHREVANA